MNIELFLMISNFFVFCQINKAVFYRWRCLIVHFSFDVQLVGKYSAIELWIFLLVARMADFS